jgi:hypothetical protein
MNRFKVHIGGRRYKYFKTLPEAVAFCSRIFKEKNIVLSIVEIK